MNQKRWATWGLVAASVLAFLVLRKVVEVFWDLGRFDFGADWYIGVPDLIAFGLSVALYFYLASNPTVELFVNDVVLELSKVSWPVRKDVQVSTVIVVVMVAIASVVLLIFNSAWAWVSQKLLTL